MSIMYAVYCAGQAVEMPAHTTWTTYTTEKEWSEGALVCEMSGGYLANLNTSHKTDVFRQLLGKAPLASAMLVSLTVNIKAQFAVVRPQRSALRRTHVLHAQKRLPFSVSLVVLFVLGIYSP